jgi:hypothetical protein
MGVSLKVIGRSKDIVAIGPNPGRTPTKVPSRHPLKHQIRLLGWKAIFKDITTKSRYSMVLLFLHNSRIQSVIPEKSVNLTY